MSSENPTPEPEATDGAPTPPPADPSETKTSQEQETDTEKQDDQEPVVTQDKGKAVADDKPETAEQEDAAEAWQAVFSPEYVLSSQSMPSCVIVPESSLGRFGRQSKRVVLLERKDEPDNVGESSRRCIVFFRRRRRRYLDKRTFIVLGNCPASTTI